ncbi:urease accessory protein UreD [Devosia sp. ZB163]|uniref:urease accessory protein UreD n=1 Tax=Devosia sp. ZB163 TaxID=3025938 RepID=UPI002360F50D|nr:urease accessory protein UreD [Devosia sp. ZB163]MDC9825881.1 urease accessory protein UreD [Devosia sp. ZB163]
MLDGRTRLTTLFQEGCAKIRLPHTHDQSLQAVLINTAGGLTGGDDVAWEIDAAPGARVVLTTQACERVYRSLGDDATVRSTITVGAGAHLDWLPQETILFEGARLDRGLEVDLAPDASFFAIEAILLGREAMGEAARNAHLRDNWRIRRGGRLIHAEATRLSADPLERDGLGLLDGANAFATLLYVGADAELKLDRVRDLLTDATGASVVGERLVVRAMAPSGLALRRIITPLIAHLSGAGTLPRLWHL